MLRSKIEAAQRVNANTVDALALTALGLKFALPYKETIATQLEVTLHAPNGSPTLIKQPYHGYQTLGFFSSFPNAAPTMLLAMPNTPQHRMAVYGCGWRWTEASLEEVFAVGCLLPECDGELLFRLVDGEWKFPAMSRCAHSLAEHLLQTCGAGRVWLPEQSVELEDVATLVAEPPDWAYFDEPSCKSK